MWNVWRTDCRKFGRTTAEKLRELGGEILDEIDLHLRTHKEEPILRPGDTDGTNDAVAAVEDGSSEGNQSAFQFTMVGGVAIAAVDFESVAEIARPVAGIGGLTVHAPTSENSEDFGIRKPGENGAAKCSAMRWNKIAWKQAHHEKSAGDVYGIEANNSAGAGNRENGTFLGAEREFNEKETRVVWQGPPKNRAGAERVEFETETKLFAVGTPLDKMNFLEGAEETVDSGLVQAEGGGELRERHVRAIFSQVKQDADGLLQRFAGARRAIYCSARRHGVRTVGHNVKLYFTK